MTKFKFQTLEQIAKSYPDPLRSPEKKRRYWVDVYHQWDHWWTVPEGEKEYGNRYHIDVYGAENINHLRALLAQLALKYSEGDEWSPHIKPFFIQFFKAADWKEGREMILTWGPTTTFEEDKLRISESIVIHVSGC